MVKFEFALTEKDTILDIKNISLAHRDCNFTCPNPECKSSMGFSIGKAINKDGTRRKDFFFHKAKYDHKGESILHYNAKYAMYGVLLNHITTNEPYYINVKCDKRGGEYNAVGKESIFNSFKQMYIRIENILENITDIDTEADCLGYRPDIVLLNGDTIVRVVEIDFKHSIEDEKLKSLKDSKIEILNVFIDNEKDVDLIRAETFDNYQYYPKACNPIFTTSKMLVDDLNHKYNKLRLDFKYFIENSPDTSKMEILGLRIGGAYTFFKLYNDTAIDMMMDNEFIKCKNSGCENVNALKNVCLKYLNNYDKFPNPYMIKAITLLNRRRSKIKISDVSLSEATPYLQRVCKHCIVMCRDNLNHCGYVFGM